MIGGSQQEKEERHAIIQFWSQGHDTFDISRMLNEPEHYIERRLHQALETRRVVKSSLAKRGDIG